MSSRTAVILEPPAQQLVEATADPGFLIDSDRPALTGTRATRASVDQATNFLRAALVAR